MAIPHDRLFKELLTTFFWEFLELFVPQVVPWLERGSLVFLDKELFTDVTAGESHEVDLVARGRFRGEQTYFLVHVESQAQHDKAFAARMFRYFARLHEAHALPVYPIALFSYPPGRRDPEPESYRVHFAQELVLDFRYYVIHLGRLDWRDYLYRENPIASALMTRMRVLKRERPHVKIACLNLLGGLGLDPARTQLVSGFIDTYLRLDQKESAQFRMELNILPEKAQEAIMKITTSWKEEGRAEGRDEAVRELSTSWKEEGRVEGLARGLRVALLLRFPGEASGLVERLDLATVDQLEAISARLLEGASVAQLRSLL